MSLRVFYWAINPQEVIDLKKKHSRSRTGPARSDNTGMGSAAAELIRRATAPKLDRKALQLCRQIEREVSLILSGELDDDRVRDLLVLSVVPYPRTNLLLVTLQSPEVLNQIQLLELDSIVAGHKPAIRHEVAMAINRRKAPDLCFRVINPGGSGMH